MAKKSQPRGGSLQYWPRKRIKKFLPSVNWKVLEDRGLLGVIAYKVGMRTCFVKDMTADSLTKDKKIFLPATIFECPPMKIFSVRFYKNGQVVNEYLGQASKRLQKILKLPKSYNKKIEDIKDYDDIRLIVYSEVEKTGIKKTPDLAEIGLGGTLEEKNNFVKENLNKDIFAGEILKNAKLVDIRGLTKGKGTQGPIKRFGIKKRQHKSEKGVRRPGTLGPWHPAHVVFRVPMAGQIGMFTRIQYNSRILAVGKINEKDINKKEGWQHYGKIKTEYLIVKGSVQGPAKRQLLLTMPLRATKSQEKLNYEFLGLR